jgi:hypothetical protein
MIKLFQEIILVSRAPTAHALSIQVVAAIESQNCIGDIAGELVDHSLASCADPSDVCAAHRRSFGSIARNHNMGFLRRDLILPISALHTSVIPGGKPFRRLPGR